MTPLLLFVATAGNCKCWSEFANRIHANPWQCRTLRRIRWLHDIGMVLTPVLLLWALSRSSWSFAELLGKSIAAWPILLACGAGFVWLVVDAIRHVTRRLPRGTSVVDSTHHDIAARVRPKPAGRGVNGAIVQLPLNESLRIDVSQKRLELPRYTPGAASLRILHLTDWHFSGAPDLPFYQHATELAAATEPDLIVFTGDLVDDRKLIPWIDDTLATLSAPLGCHFILGNHDWFTGHDSVRQYLVNAGWRDCGGKVLSVEHENMTFALGGNERPWIGPAPDLVACDADLRLALIHTPDLFGWAREQDADLVLAGHNHGGQVVLPAIGPVYSPSRHGVRYAGGLYRRGDTLMHVGRGLGGLHPLRWRCLPEITLLEIASPGEG